MLRSGYVAQIPHPPEPRFLRCCSLSIFQYAACPDPAPSARPHFAVGPSPARLSSLSHRLHLWRESLAVAFPGSATAPLRTQSKQAMQRIRVSFSTPRNEIARRESRTLG